MAVATAGLHSDGATLTYKIGVATAVVVGELIDCDIGSLKRTTVPKKRVSPANSIKKKMKGLMEVDAWKFTVGFTSAQMADLFAMWSAGTEAAWEVNFPDTSSFKIPNGWLADFKPPALKEDEELIGEVTVENDGTLPVWTEET